MRLQIGLLPRGLRILIKNFSELRIQNLYCIDFNYVCKPDVLMTQWIASARMDVEHKIEQNKNF